MRRQVITFLSFHFLLFINLFSPQNRRLPISSKRTCHRTSILTTVLTVSLLANILLLLLLYRGGDTESKPSFDLASQHQQVTATCDHKNPSPSPPLQVENISLSAVQEPCPEITKAGSDVPLCSVDHRNLKKLRAEAKKYQNIFQDLSVKEIQSVYDYLKRERTLGVSKTSRARFLKERGTIFRCDFYNGLTGL